MTTLNISLPEQLREFVEGQVAKGSFSTLSEYIRQLIREAQKNEAQRQLEARLLEGLEADSAELSAEDWESIRRDVRDRLSWQRRS